jgi:phosphoglycerate-specific signal transduction histidine kinase
MPVHYFDLELQTRSGITLSKQRMSTEYGGQPILVAQGLSLDMVWDIAIKHIDPKLLKSLMPSVTGLTSRLQDRDNHEFTIFGNMRLNRDLKDKALALHNAEIKLKETEKIIREEARKNPRNMFEDYPKK